MDFILLLYLKNIGFFIVPIKYYSTETNDLDKIYFHHHVKHQSNKQLGFKNGINIHNLKLNQSYLRIKKRKNILNSKRRIILQNKDAFNDYVTVSVGKIAVLECNLENFNNEKVFIKKLTIFKKIKVYIFR
jgi:hypothetical protein